MSISVKQVSYFFFLSTLYIIIFLPKYNLLYYNIYLWPKKKCLETIVLKVTCASEFDYKGVKHNEWMNLENNSISGQRSSADIVVRIIIL